VLARRRRQAWPAAGTARPRRGRWILIAAALAAICCAAVARGTGTDRAVLAASQRFALFYSGVFALIALTAAVAAGLVAVDRIVMTPAGRVTSQAVHRALALAAVGFLATHVLMEVLAHRSRPVDAVAPFLASGRTLYLGLGTLASDLMLVILATGVARRRFTGWPATWRALHVTAYLAWPLAIWHGLLAGRHAKPYVDWSYGACLAAVALALVIRLVATTRSRTEVAPYPVPEPAALPARRGEPARALVPPQQAVSLPGQPTHRQAAPPDGIQHGPEPRLCRSPPPRFSASGSRASPLALTGSGG
jgi:DMSO/TMAO reductase YedYZ heme-binding membrane subunit